ncbi:collagen alpha-1(I) chain-like [Meriones unguiculatus]|uniref:collagen alpha-1(I) chain-like n=1 Tax=Meriones unguiculatus TaxID=10047 RepID=UPI00293EB0CD|nr:collagen alpha-1(I) chain-like [Meriones unguiculatus]XP_060222294.1 collagen alpha-1(I) chain-like [Meriones unguiculatus]XP_060222295.1 collagen alpha-1(I) chain-like [Meriones unguiculatus]XP_060222296.1 collagen alpha-1(I) chain-like [Meriones unguiculatus]XP_060222298.1 collagen alpha-1(I) chain-like [Meriones unguiculatus]
MDEAAAAGRRERASETGVACDNTRRGVATPSAALADRPRHDRETQPRPPLLLLLLPPRHRESRTANTGRGARVRSGGGGKGAAGRRSGRRRPPAGTTDPPPPPTPRGAEARDGHGGRRGRNRESHTRRSPPRDPSEPPARRTRPRARHTAPIWPRQETAPAGTAGVRGRDGASAGPHTQRQRGATPGKSGIADPPSGRSPGIDRERAGETTPTGRGGRSGGSRASARAGGTGGTRENADRVAGETGGETGERRAAETSGRGGNIDRSPRRYRATGPEEPPDAPRPADPPKTGNCSRKPLLPSRGAGRTRETSPGATQRPHAERGRSRGAGTALQLLHPHTPSGLSRTAPNARGATARARGDPPPEGGTGPGQHGRGGRPGHEGAGSGGRGGGTTRQGRDAGDGGGDDGNGPPHPSTHRERGRPRPGGDRPNTGGRKRTGITPLTLRERSRHTRGAEPSRPQKRRRPPPTGSPGETQRERLPNADATAAEGPSSGNGTPPTSDDEPDAADRRLQKAAPEREIDTPPRPGRPRIPRRGERSPALPQPWERCRGGGASGTTPRHTNRPQRTHHARQRPSRGNGKDGDAHGRAARGGRPRGGGRGTGTGGTGSPPPPFRYPSRGAPRGWDGADRARAGVHTRPFHHRYRQPPPREPNTPRHRHDAELLPRVIPPRTRSEEARAALEKERFLTEGGAYPTRPSTPGRGQPEKRRACGRDAHATRPPSSNGGKTRTRGVCVMARLPGHAEGTRHATTRWTLTRRGAPPLGNGHPKEPLTGLWVITLDPPSSFSSTVSPAPAERARTHKRDGKQREQATHAASKQSRAQEAPEGTGNATAAQKRAPRSPGTLQGHREDRKERGARTPTGSGTRRRR